MKRILSWCLALALILGCIPGQIFATALQEESLQPAGESLCAYGDVNLLDNDALFAGYAWQMFYGSATTYRRLAGDLLTGDEKVLYDAMVPVIRQIAAGQRSSTVIGVGPRYEYGGLVYGGDAAGTFTGSDLTQEALDRLLWALLTDLPYEMYWYDKVNGCRAECLVDGSGRIVCTRFAFQVADNYQGSDTYTVNTAIAQTAATAARNSAAIVSKYAAKTDYEKLVGYKNEICNLVSYDFDAAAGGYFTYDDDPWQLIHVFDGDSSTNVVCEGYSKAFMYLCEQTTFSGDTSCITVSGYMEGGAHMWNIVTMDGANYLADVTNSESDTAGYDGRLFLAGGTGSASAGYRVAGYRYTYYTNELNFWGTGADSVLTLANKNYTPHVHSYDKNMVCTGCDYKGVDVQIVAVTLRPQTAGLYYSSEVLVDEAIAVSGMGVTLSLTNQMPTVGDDESCMWTEGFTSVQVSNILKENKKAARADMYIYARAYVRLQNGTYIYSDAEAMNLRQVVEQANARWTTLDNDQKTAIAAMYTRFESIMETWNVAAIRAYAQ